MYKKIVITSNSSWFVANFFSSSIVEFMKNNNEVIVIAPRDINSEKLINLGCSYFDIPVCRSGINPIEELKTLFKLHCLLSTLSPDCVLNFTPKLNIYSTLVSRWLGIKVINSIAGLGSIASEKGLKSLLGRILFRVTQPLSDHTIFQNNDDLAFYLKRKYVKPEKCSRVHGIGVELSKFKPVHSNDDGTVRFILFARMLRNKGVVDFIHAAEAVKEHYEIRSKASLATSRFEFSLLGFIDEENPQGLPLSAIKYWDRNTIVSYIGETDDVFSVVKDFDCVVLPSYYREGIPHCLIESCAMAKPIITTDNVGCRETVIDSLSGYIVQPQCVPDLKQAMINMIELSHQERLAMGKQGRKKAEKDYCHIGVAKHYMHTINTILQR
ncbi:glycosyltransferase family 4 protein [Vibrio lamellibrachiae]|uniref:glycosyltransferase family 4 protein n=1 Tax=Vibrio lamellibrachiae TaxID=2910253 RepID=UPI003D10F34E